MTVAQGPAGDGPPTEGIEALLTLVAFVVVMTAVPWLMARGAGEVGASGASGLPDASDASDGQGEGGLFASARERRLWLATGAVLIAIWLTLSPAQELAAYLRARNLLRVTSTAVFLVVLVAAALRWATTGPGRREAGAALGIVAVGVTTWIRLPIPEARSHLFEYGLLALLVHHALLERRRVGRTVRAPAVVAVVTTAGLGWLDEGIQQLLPTRSYDLFDVGFNALAALMAVTASTILVWARSRDRRR